MALKAGRVGVAPSQVDSKGNVISGSSVTVVDNLNSTSSTDALSAKQGKVLKDGLDTKEDASKLGGFEFRTNEGTPQYRTSSTGEWLNFSSGAEVPVFEDTDSTCSCLMLFRMSAPTSEYKLDFTFHTSNPSADIHKGDVELVELTTGYYVCMAKLTLGSSSSAGTYKLKLYDGTTLKSITNFAKDSTVVSNTYSGYTEIYKDSNASSIFVGYKLI